MKLTKDEGRWLLDMLDMQEEQLSFAGHLMMGDHTTTDPEKDELATETFQQLQWLDSIRKKVTNERRRPRRSAARSLWALLHRLQRHAGASTPGAYGPRGHRS